MRNRNPHFFCVKSELGVGTRGASLGPDALMIQAAKVGSDIFKQRPVTEYQPGQKPLYHPPRTPHGRYFEHILPRWASIAETTQQLAVSDDFPVFLTGDHSSAGAIIAGLKIAHPDKSLGVVWIDAHLDLHTPYTSRSGNVHGMPLGASLGLTSTTLNLHEIQQDTADHWKAMVELGGIRPKIKPEDLVFHGIRSYEAPEWALVQELGMHYYTVEDYRKEGAESMAKQTMERLDNCEMIYISFDVDSLDAKIAPGTGTPEANGYTAREAKGLLTELLKSDKLAGLEFTELNPLIESPKTLEVVFDIFQHAMQN